MIKVIKSDLIKLALNNEFEIIAHSCNCFNCHGAGIAKQISITFSEASQVDNKTKRGDKNKLGGISYTTNTSPIVVNLYSQFDTRNKFNKTPLNYDALEKSLIKLKEFAISNNLTKIGIPLIGCGLAGGNIEKVLQIVLTVFNNKSDLTIVIYEKDFDCDNQYKRVIRFMNDFYSN